VFSALDVLARRCAECQGHPVDATHIKLIEGEQLADLVPLSTGRAE
jgi:hypothetical protein